MDYNSFVPLGIPAFGGEKENGKIHFTYDIIFEDAIELTLQIRERHKEIYKEIITEKKRLTKGLHYWQWDGFDNAGILDTSKIIGKSLNLYITARSKRGGVVRKCLDFKLSYSEVNWVDVKINRPDKKIFITLRVDLKDGGEKGLTCTQSSLQSITANSYSVGGCPWDFIPKNRIKAIRKPPIKSRTRSFEKLRDLVLEGIAYHWSRNKLPTSNIATGVNITGQDYEVFVDAVNTTENAMNSVKLIFNTNSEWGRSGNPGAFARIFYNVGYLKYSDGWGYQSQLDADRDFEETSAHEIGHTILKSYGNTVYSWQHRGSSYFLPQDAKPTLDSDSWEKIKEQYTHIDFYTINKMSYTFGEYYPSKGEIDLMKYYHTRNPKGNIVAYPDKTRTVASEKDVLGLLWLTKMIIIK